MLPSQSAEVILTFEPEDLSPPILDNPFIKSNKIDKIDQPIWGERGIRIYIYIYMQMYV